ncbi:unnamed protein product [Protopolystoma xenopodis]|uniref:Uncharacterized protein n=1 Tax=Protopolystoma xenopodis TaxID=117903 RepID=A0A3S5AZJ5_9PLAT|nr:unnamed protein product [Protopolystoma xenopodis]
MVGAGLSLTQSFAFCVIYTLCRRLLLISPPQYLISSPDVIRLVDLRDQTPTFPHDKRTHATLTSQRSLLHQRTPTVLASASRFILPVQSEMCQDLDIPAVGNYPVLPST